MTTIMLVGGSETEAPTHFGERLVREVGFRFEAPPRILSCQLSGGMSVAERKLKALCSCGRLHRN